MTIVNCYRAKGAALLVAGLMFLATGCASTGPGSAGDGSSRNVITQQEIQETDVSNLYEVVRRLRPTWLQVRTTSMKGEEIVVVRSGTVIGNVDALRDIGRDGITEMRFMDGETAAATLVGARSGYVAGAIVIERGS